MTTNPDEFRVLGLAPFNLLQVAVNKAGDLIITSRHNPDMRIRVSSIADSSGFYLRTDRPSQINTLNDQLFEMVKKDD